MDIFLVVRSLRNILDAPIAIELVLDNTTTRKIELKNQSTLNPRLGDINRPDTNLLQVYKGHAADSTRPQTVPKSLLFNLVTRLRKYLFLYLFFF